MGIPIFPVERAGMITAPGTGSLECPNLPPGGLRSALSPGRWGFLCLLVGVVWVSVLSAPSAIASYEQQRRDMVERYLRKPGPGLTSVRDTATLRAMRTVPRHRFVPRGWVSRAYENRALPIGHGQTISQPYIVGLMTQLLKPNPDDVVLEIGTGSGYQAAVLSRIVNRVYTIEIIPELSHKARRRLDKLGYNNVQTRIGDGYYGWEEEAPFDGIIVTAAASHIPPPLVQQLKNGGRMIIPVGPPMQVQRLMLVEKTPEGQLRQRSITSVVFVPFVRGNDS